MKSIGSQRTVVRYWGRKSRELAQAYIQRFTSPNEIVADYFGGSGVFVKTALELQRRAVYVDLNPFAHLIARNTIKKCNLEEFSAAAKGLLSEDEVSVRNPALVKVSKDDLFSIRCKCGRRARVLTIVYRRTYRRLHTPRKLTGLQRAVHKSIARREVIFHEDLVALHPELSTQVLSYVVKGFSRRGYVREVDFPVRANFASKCACGRTGMKLHGRMNWSIKGDIQPAHWFPRLALKYPDGASFLKKRDAEKVADFFTERNLAALSWLWRSIESLETTRDTRDCLKLAFMGTLVRSSKMSRPSGGPWSVNSYWIPRTYAVRNPFVIFRNVVSSMMKTLEVESQVSTGSLQKVVDGNADVTFLLSDSTRALLPRNSVDYVIIDPPHTNEVQYFELSSFYTAWLRKELNYGSELTLNSKQGKDIETYLKLLTRASKGIYDSLKNNGYYTVILHGRDSKMLDRCVDSIGDAGFRFLEKKKSDGFTIYTFKKNRKVFEKWSNSS